MEGHEDDEGTITAKLAYQFHINLDKVIKIYRCKIKPMDHLI